MATNLSSTSFLSRGPHLSPSHHHSGPKNNHSLPDILTDKDTHPLGMDQWSSEGVHSMPTYPSTSEQQLYYKSEMSPDRSTYGPQDSSYKHQDRAYNHQDFAYRHQDRTYRSQDHAYQNQDSAYKHQDSSYNIDEGKPSLSYSSSDNVDYHKNLPIKRRSPNLQIRSHSEEIISLSVPHVTNSHATTDIMPPVQDSKPSSLPPPPPPPPPPHDHPHIYSSSPPSPPPSSVPHLLPAKPPQSISKEFFSGATLENERYSIESFPRPDHQNEDRYFSLEGTNFKVIGVFDGHDGSRAADFASHYMEELFYFDSWRKIINSGANIAEVLREMFLDTEREFFKNIQNFIDEKESLQKVIPPHLTSYAAYQRYPREVARLQEIEPMLSGGCTVALATVIKNRLYVANVGDSRVVLIRERSDGILEAEQLSVDHSVEDKDELERLGKLGLNREDLVKSGRLGMQENTRSIGDYSIKQGYKDVDSLRSASSSPGTATPYIMTSKEIDSSFKYLILMTDGVYKSIGSTIKDHDTIDDNKVVLNMMDHSLRKGNFQTLSDTLLGRVARIHMDCYEKNAKLDPRSPLAVGCRKRDDMTLLIYKFPALSNT